MTVNLGRLNWMLRAPGPLPTTMLSEKSFHGRVEDLFHRTPQAVNLVDEEHVALRRLVQIAARSPALLDSRPGSHLEVGAHPCGEDV